MRTLVAVALCTLGITACAPPRILSANTISKEPKKVFAQLAAALKPAGYTCKEETDDHSFSAFCQGPHGGLVVEVKRKTKRPILAQRFSFTHKLCGTPEMNAKLEAYNLADASGGNHAFCYEDRLVLSFETFIPSEGIEATELAQLVTTWEKTVGGNLERMGLLPPAEPSGEKS
jgi:hypothetical protein